jgi:hypothetical protein
LTSPSDINDEPAEPVTLPLLLAPGVAECVPPPDALEPLVVAGDLLLGLVAGPVCAIARDDAPSNKAAARVAVLVIELPP